VLRELRARGYADESGIGLLEAWAEEIRQDERVKWSIESRDDAPAPYFIEIEKAPCDKCGGGKTWNVIGPNGQALSTSWSDEEHAQDVADECNSAFDLGRNSSGRFTQARLADEAVQAKVLEVRKEATERIESYRQTRQHPSLTLYDVERLESLALPEPPLEKWALKAAVELGRECFSEMSHEDRARLIQRCYKEKS
jgi:hypothetical protein